MTPDLRKELDKPVVECKKIYISKYCAMSTELGCPSKISRRELEDLYYSVLGANVDLKKTLNDQHEKIKVLSTKVQRLTTMQKNNLNKEQRNSLVDDKSIINEQKMAHASVSAANLLRSTPNLVHRGVSSLDHGSPKNVKHTGTSPERSEESNKSPSAYARNRRYPARVPLSQRLARPLVKPKPSEKPSEKPFEKPPSPVEKGQEETKMECCQEECNAGKCKAEIEALKNKVSALEEELAKTHEAYKSQVARLEGEVSDLHADSERQRSNQEVEQEENRQREREMEDVAAKLREAEALFNDLSLALTLEKMKVAEVEAKAKAEQMSNDVAKNLEEHKLKDELEEAPVADEQLDRRPRKVVRDGEPTTYYVPINKKVPTSNDPKTSNHPEKIELPPSKDIKDEPTSTSNPRKSDQLPQRPRLSIAEVMKLLTEPEDKFQCEAPIKNTETAHIDDDQTPVETNTKDQLNKDESVTIEKTTPSKNSDLSGESVTDEETETVDETSTPDDEDETTTDSITQTSSTESETKPLKDEPKVKPEIMPSKNETKVKPEIMPSKNETKVNPVTNPCKNEPKGIPDKNPCKYEPKANPVRSPCKHYPKVQPETTNGAKCKDKAGNNYSGGSVRTWEGVPESMKTTGNEKYARRPSDKSRPGQSLNDKLADQTDLQICRNKPDKEEDFKTPAEEEVVKESPLNVQMPSEFPSEPSSDYRDVPTRDTTPDPREFTPGLLSCFDSGYTDPNKSSPPTEQNEIDAPNKDLLRKIEELQQQLNNLKDLVLPPVSSEPNGDVIKNSAPTGPDDLIRPEEESLMSPKELAEKRNREKSLESGKPSDLRRPSVESGKSTSSSPRKTVTISKLPKGQRRSYASPIPSDPRKKSFQNEKGTSDRRKSSEARETPPGRKSLDPIRGSNVSEIPPAASLKTYYESGKSPSSSRTSLLPGKPPSEAVNTYEPGPNPAQIETTPSQLEATTEMARAPAGVTGATPQEPMSFTPAKRSENIQRDYIYKSPRASKPIIKPLNESFIPLREHDIEKELDPSVEKRSGNKKRIKLSVDNSGWVNKDKIANFASQIEPPNPPANDAGNQILALTSSRATSPANTDQEYSSYSNFSSDARSPRYMSPGEDKATTTYTDASAGTNTDFGYLSEGELPVTPSQNVTDAKIKENVSFSKAEPSPTQKMEAALKGINEELARCRLLLQAHQPKTKTEHKDSEAMANLDAEGNSEARQDGGLRLKRSEGSPQIGDKSHPKCNFTLHIGNIVLSDQAVMSARRRSLLLMWQFYQQTATMANVRVDRVIPFDFSTQYDVKIDDVFIDYMKSHDLIIRICEVDRQNEPFIVCALPLRDSLLNPNRRVDMSLALLAGPGMSRVEDGAGLGLSEEAGVLDVWCQLTIDQNIQLPTEQYYHPRPTNVLHMHQIADENDLTSTDDLKKNEGGLDQQDKSESGVIVNEVSPSVRTTDELKHALETRSTFQSTEGSDPAVNNRKTSQEDKLAVIPSLIKMKKRLSGTRKNNSSLYDIMKNPAWKKLNITNNHRKTSQDNQILDVPTKKSVKIRHRAPSGAKDFTSEGEKDYDIASSPLNQRIQTMDITVLWLALNEDSDAMTDPNVQRLYVSYSFLGRTGAELETPVSLPKPKHYSEKCYFHFKKMFHIEDSDFPLLGHLARCRSPARSLPDSKRDCLVFNVINEPPEDPLGLDNCEDIGTAYLYLGDILAYSAGSNTYTEVIPVICAKGSARACGVLCVRVGGLDVVRECRVLNANDYL